MDKSDKSDKSTNDKYTMNKQIIEFKENTKKINEEELEKMIFIYNAIMDGWTVKKSKKSDNRFEFRKKKIIEYNEVKDYINKMINSNEMNEMNEMITNAEQTNNDNDNDNNTIKDIYYYKYFIQKIMNTERLISKKK